MKIHLIKFSTIFFLFGLFIFPSNGFSQSNDNDQDPKASKILKGIYPSNCKSILAKSDIKWGIPLALGFPQKIRLVRVFLSNSYMGEENSSNDYPITKMKYGNYLICLVTGRLSNDRMINGFYTQWTNLAPEPNTAHGNRVGTYVQFNGIIYKAEEKNIQSIVNSGNYKIIQNTKFLGKVYPKSVKSWVGLN